MSSERSSERSDMKQDRRDADENEFPATPGDAPAPLGDAPSYDTILDRALELTFPGSDPISVQDACRAAAQDEERR
jgi:hypothetical protein